jgi:hypothetical protein
MVKAAAERANTFLSRRNSLDVAAVWEVVAAAARDASPLYQELLLSDAAKTAKACIAALQEGLDDCSCPPTNRHGRPRRPTCDEAVTTLDSILIIVSIFQAVLLFCKETGLSTDPPTLYGAVNAYRARHAPLWGYLQDVCLHVEYHTPGLLSDVHFAMIEWVNWRKDDDGFDQTRWEEKVRCLTWYTQRMVSSHT